MGLFGALGNLVSATVKVAVTPLTVTKDILEGEPFETTGDVLDSAADDVGDAIDEIL